MLRHLSAGADVNRFVLASLVRLRFRFDSESAIFDHSAASPYSQCCATYRLAPMSTDLSSLRSFVSAFASTPSQPYSTTPPHRHIHNVAPLIGWRRCQQICPRFARSSPLSLRLRVSHIRPLRRIAIFTMLRHLSAGADVNRFVLASLVRLRFRFDSESAIFDHSAASPYSRFRKPTSGFHHRCSFYIIRAGCQLKLFHPA